MHLGTMEEISKDQAISQEQPVIDVSAGRVLDQDEYRLAQLGYKQGERLLCAIASFSVWLRSLIQIWI